MLQSSAWRQNACPPRSSSRCQQDVRQQRTERATLRCRLRPRADHPLCHHPRFQIPSDQFQYPPIANLLRQLRHQKVVIDPIEELLQIHVHHDAPAFGNILLCRLDRLMGVPPRSEAVARHAAQPPPDTVRAPLPAPHLADGLLSFGFIEKRSPTRVLPCSALRSIPAATTASADFLTRIPTPHDVSSTMAPVRISPGMTHPPSRLYLSDIRHSVPCKFRALTILAASPRCNASYPLPPPQGGPRCSSGQRFSFGFLQIRSYPRHPCRSANSSPCRASRGLSPPSECALPGAPRKNAPSRARLSSTSHA